MYGPEAMRGIQIGAVAHAASIAPTRAARAEAATMDRVRTPTPYKALAGVR
jgi:hypothetical protein